MNAEVATATSTPTTNHFPLWVQSLPPRFSCIIENFEVVPDTDTILMLDGCTDFAIMEAVLNLREDYAVKFGITDTCLSKHTLFLYPTDETYWKLGLFHMLEVPEQRVK